MEVESLLIDSSVTDGRTSAVAVRVYLDSGRLVVEVLDPHRQIEHIAALEVKHHAGTLTLQIRDPETPEESPPREMVRISNTYCIAYPTQRT